MDIMEKKKARIRTIREALSEIKAADPDTAVTYNFIRKLCDNHSITFFWAGKKILINYDELLRLLNMEAA